MGTRSELQEVLEGIQENTYFQPPESLKMEYPCIRYKRVKHRIEHANNGVYSTKTRYQVTAISKDADSTWHFELLGLPLVRHDRSYTANGLHHDVFELYF